MTVAPATFLLHLAAETRSTTLGTVINKIKKASTAHTDMDPHTIANQASSPPSHSKYQKRTEYPQHLRHGPLLSRVLDSLRSCDDAITPAPVTLFGRYGYVMRQAFSAPDAVGYFPESAVTLVAQAARQCTHAVVQVHLPPAVSNMLYTQSGGVVWGAWGKILEEQKGAHYCIV